ncbi:MAG: hypothetical protein IKS34_00345 [Clostridia bacterium]|nr:hypothetical protein [Clostridia bacterium]
MTGSFVRHFSAVLLLVIVISLCACETAGRPNHSVPELSAGTSDFSENEEPVSVDKQAERYRAAEELEKMENYGDAAQVYDSLGDYSDAEQKKEACLLKQTEEYYSEAVRLYGERQYEEAKEYFVYLGDYKDAAEYVEKCEAGMSRERFWSLLSEKEPGETIVFGHKKAGSTGEADLKWIILRRDVDRVLVLSEEVLAEMPLISGQDGTEAVVLLPLTWMNGEFLDGAFTSAEADMLRAGAEDPSGDPFFLLSAEDAEQLPENTAAAVRTAGGSTAPSGWWLAPRSSESDDLPDDLEDGLSSVVDEAGILQPHFKDAGTPFGVRPAVWIGR